MNSYPLTLKEEELEDFLNGLSEEKLNDCFGFFINLVSLDYNENGKNQPSGITSDTYQIWLVQQTGLESEKDKSSPTRSTLKNFVVKRLIEQLRSDDEEALEQVKHRCRVIQRHLYDYHANGEESENLVAALKMLEEKGSFKKFSGMKPVGDGGKLHSLANALLDKGKSLHTLRLAMVIFNIDPAVLIREIDQQALTANEEEATVPRPEVEKPENLEEIEDPNLEPKEHASADSEEVMETDNESENSKSIQLEDEDQPIREFTSTEISGVKEPEINGSMLFKIKHLTRHRWPLVLVLLAALTVTSIFGFDLIPGLRKKEEGLRTEIDSNALFSQVFPLSDEAYSDINGPLLLTDTVYQEARLINTRDTAALKQVLIKMKLVNPSHSKHYFIDAIYLRPLQARTFAGKILANQQSIIATPNLTFRLDAEQTWPYEKTVISKQPNGKLAPRKGYFTLIEVTGESNLSATTIPFMLMVKVHDIDGNSEIIRSNQVFRIAFE